MSTGGYKGLDGANAMKTIIDSIGARAGFDVGAALNGYEGYTFAEVQKYGQAVLRSIASITDSGMEGAYAKRLALLGSSTRAYLPAYLAMEGLLNNLLTRVYVDGDGRFRQSISDNKSGLYEFAPDMVFWHLETEGFLTPLELASGEWDIERVLSDIESLCGCLINQSRANIYITGFHVQPSFPYFDLIPKSEQRLREFNDALRGRFGGNARIRICRFDDLCSFIGHKNVTDKNSFRLARIYYSHEFSRILSKKIISALVSFARPRIKCIVLDLDNTIWGGVIGDDGPDGIKIGPEHPGYCYQGFQSQLLQLARQGVLLAINSKNSMEEAMAVFENGPNMILRPSDFQAVRINWEEKHVNMREMAQELNIGLSDMLFLDDSDVECEKMRTFLPEVATIKVPGNPDLIMDILPAVLGLNAFELSTEDTRRGELYAQRRERMEFASSAGGMKEFLAALGTELHVRTPAPAEYRRVHQLIIKTNQFNMTTMRYDIDMLEGMLSSMRFFPLVLNVIDRFGDSGLVGVAIIDKGETGLWRLDTFLMSCRVLGREVEDTFFKHIIGLAASHGVRKLNAPFVPTTKNKPFADFYRRMGMIEKGEHKGALVYEIDPSAVPIEIPDYMKIIASRGGA